MLTPTFLRCDGCGQPASLEHIAKRLKRLEWTTRYRPVHIGTLLLGAVAPRDDADFLYAEGTAFGGEAGIILEAGGLSASGRPAETVLAEFQRGGFFLAYVHDCPLEKPVDSVAAQGLLERRLAATVARIRRSLKPKRMVPIASSLEPVLDRLQRADLGCSIVLDDGKPFALDGNPPGEVIARLRHALAGVTATGR